MEAKFTPGPWVVDENLILSGDLRVADVYHMEPIKPGATDANARLIAAAPELLAALKLVVDHAGGVSGTITGADWAIIRAAIAKVEGGSV